jgi:hypothetical protein
MGRAIGATLEWNTLDCIQAVIELTVFIHQRQVDSVSAPLPYYIGFLERWSKRILAQPNSVLGYWHLVRLFKRINLFLFIDQRVEKESKRWPIHFQKGNGFGNLIAK